MIDRTLNTIVKDVILKGIIVVYDDHSPTRNRKAAIRKMLMADEFIANHRENMTADSLSSLEELTSRLVQSEQCVSTRWRDVIVHPVDTYRSAREFKKSAGKLLDNAITASSLANLQRWRASQQQAENAVEQIPGAETGRASRDGMDISASQGNTVVAATSSLAAPLSAPFDLAGSAGDSIAYIHFGDSDIRIGPNTRAKLEFDRDAFRMVLFPNRPPEPAAVVQPIRTATRTASVFTATGTARIVAQPQHASSSESSETDGDDTLSLCKFEWLEGPIITALTEDEGIATSGSDSESSSDE
ncbi:hypothetical protein V8D89_013137 [Ganoderma adspersum]